MKIKFFLIVLIFFIGASVFAQNSINNYKYIIVPNKFDFLKEKNQYQMNSLTKFLFNKYGFEAVMKGSEYPKDLIINRCLGLETDVIKESGMFKTKLLIELSDCNNKVIYKSNVGESREKDYKTAYNLALRDAFKSVKASNYKYESNQNMTSISAVPQGQIKNEVSKEIQQLKKEIQNLKKEKVAEIPIGEAPNILTTQPKTFKKEDVKEINIIEGVSNVLYAQAIDNGFQLVNSFPKVVYRIKHTNLKDFFLVEGSSAIIYKKEDYWVIEYYSENSLEQDVLNIKF